MHKISFIFFLILFNSVVSQNTNDFVIDEFEDDYIEEVSFANDTIVYNKNTNISEQRQFHDDLKNKYAGKDFEYIDNLKKPEPVEEKELDSTGIDLFLGFMSSFFPYLLGIIVLLILLKSFVNIDAGFWKFGKQTKKVSKKEVYDDEEDIHEHDYEELLRLAIKNANYRLATRYYYLLLLKNLSHKKLISYHKDKTNTEYQFELKNKYLRSKFSQLVYIYDYVWYGEFAINEMKFNLIEEKYQSFIKGIR